MAKATAYLIITIDTSFPLPVVTGARIDSKPVDAAELEGAVEVEFVVKTQEADTFEEAAVDLELELVAFFAPQALWHMVKHQVFYAGVARDARENGIFAPSKPTGKRAF